MHILFETRDTSARNGLHVIEDVDEIILGVIEEERIVADPGNRVDVVLAACKTSGSGGSVDDGRRR
jgi:hypothetical protein